MSSNNDGGPAFPTSTTGKWAGIGANATFVPDMTDGMSLRDWFAGQALAAIVNDMVKKGYPGAESPGGRNALHYGAKMAYDLADAMLKARNAGKEQE